MPKITSFINYKGGVGKTTLAVEVSASLAYRSQRKVLLVDLDPQTNATLSLMNFDEWENWAKLNGSLKNLVEDYLLRRSPNELASETRQAIRTSFRFRIDQPGCFHLLPSHLQLMNVDLDIVDFFGAYSLEGLRILSAILTPISENYDYIILDCPPNLGLLTQNAMMISDSIIVVCMPDYLSTIGIGVLENAVSDFTRRVNERLKLLHTSFQGPTIKGIVFNRIRYRSGGTAQEESIIERIERQYPALVFQPPARVSFSTKISERSEVGVPIAISGYAADRDYEAQIRAVADEFQRRV